MLVDLHRLQELLTDFAEERDWVRHHTVRNLAMALGGEVGELLAVLQWEPESALEDPKLRSDFEDEMADVLIYLARLASVANVDLDAAVTRKMERNAERFPTNHSESS